uniref:CSON013662 protein n=1 Tax=Culicoides sonorensis TaxID=179676 RepID=A0A336LHD0_CULSO
MEGDLISENILKATCTACLKEIDKSIDDTSDLVQIYKDLLSINVTRLPIDFVVNFCIGCKEKLKSIRDFKSLCLTSIEMLEQSIEISMDVDFTMLNDSKIVDEILQETLSNDSSILDNPIEGEESFLSEFLKPLKKRSTIARTYCSICLINVPKITKHAVEVHSILNEDNNLQCTACAKIFACREKFVEHFDLHREYDTPKQCEYCNDYFVKRPDYDRHIALHNKAKRPGNRYKCSDCDKYFSNTTLVKYHKIKDHEGGMQCRYCPMAFRKEDEKKYNEHLKKEETRKHTRPSKQKHVCAFCGDEKSDSSSLYEHIRRYHTDDSFTCALCNKTFRSKFAFKHHFSAVHGESKHECSDCGRRFKLKSGLKTHLLSHAPSESCTICGKKLSPRYMSHHMKLHSLPNKQGEKIELLQQTCPRDPVFIFEIHEFSLPIEIMN